MRLYKVKWLINEQVFSESEEAFWTDSELEQVYNNQVRGINNVVRYEYEFIKEIKLPNLF
jgi:hypothetical protein